MCNRNRCRRSDVTGRGTVGHDNGDKCCVASPGSVTWRVTHDGQHVTRDSQRTSASPSEQYCVSNHPFIQLLNVAIKLNSWGHSAVVTVVRKISRK